MIGLDRIGRLRYIGGHLSLHVPPLLLQPVSNRPAKAIRPVAYSVPMANRGHFQAMLEAVFQPLRIRRCRLAGLRVRRDPNGFGGVREVRKLSLAIGIGLLGAMLGGCRAPAFSKVEKLQDLVVAELSDEEAGEPLVETAAEMSLELQTSLMENLDKGGREETSGRPDQAARYYQRILRVDPTHAEAHQRLARLAAEAGDFRQSERHYRMALEKYPESARLWGDLAQCLAVQNRAGEAKEALQRSVHLSTRAIAGTETPWKVAEGGSEAAEPKRLDVVQLDPATFQPPVEIGNSPNRHTQSPLVRPDVDMDAGRVRQSSTFPVEVARSAAKPYLPGPVIQRIQEPASGGQTPPYALASLDRDAGTTTVEAVGEPTPPDGSREETQSVSSGSRTVELPLWTLPAE